MIETILLTHSILVKVLLAFLVLGVFIPKITASNPLKFKKSSLIYTMIFQALMTMIAFSGVVALIVGELPFGISTIIMIIIFALMMTLEIMKYKKIKKANLEDESTFTTMRLNFIKIDIINIIILVIMVVLMILKAKGIIVI